MALHWTTQVSLSLTGGPLVTYKVLHGTSVSPEHHRCSVVRWLTLGLGVDSSEV